MHLTHWTIVKHPFSFSHFLRGKVYGHPEFADGTTVSTSTLEKMEWVNDKLFATTKNHRYELLDMSCLVADRLEKSFNQVKDVVESLENSVSRLEKLQ